ncbi:hypothetical protein B0H14DRAFT_3481364 [Mycena olivaceomarginata]|nr:hypothetical protein B0H14DRAFT_3481364 [Mycena olivaceomarginata]
MCDTSDILQSSVLFWMLSLIPVTIFPYLALGLLSTSFIVYALRHNCPAVRIVRLKNEIAVVDAILTHAKAERMRDYLALIQAETQFLRTKLAVSRLHSRLLEARNMPGWKNYLRDIFTISRALAMLEREVRDIQTSLLVLIEAAHQRKLTADIHEGQEIGDGVLHPQYSEEALDLLDRRVCHDMDLEPRDMQLLSSFVTLHSRTPFTDYDVPDQKRHLMRLWMSIPTSQPLPPKWAEYWGDVRAGSVRGGFRGSFIMPQFLAYENRQAETMKTKFTP